MFEMEGFYGAKKDSGITSEKPSQNSVATEEGEKSTSAGTAIQASDSSESASVIQKNAHTSAKLVLII